MILDDFFLISADKMPILFIFGYLKSMVAGFVNQVIKNARLMGKIRLEKFLHFLQWIVLDLFKCRKMSKCVLNFKTQ